MTAQRTRPDPQVDAVVLGGGPAGATVARMLAQWGDEVARRSLATWPPILPVAPRTSVKGGVTVIGVAAFVKSRNEEGMLRSESFDADCSACGENAAVTVGGRMLSGCDNG
ncbi:MAG: hypothetical protein CK531_08260 [Gemmatimonadetes bacterium]|nr:MAG: hypothetical protein CK531_10430 [Gemmatimonadota bacterium]PHX96676.1 MAG: hypothetical protein CK531_08260 [Gemmatimonadota bacterium]